MARSEHKVPLWRLGGLSPWRVVVKSLEGFRDNHLGARSAQFAYYSMLVIAPMLILIIACVAYLPLEDVIGNILESLQRQSPGLVYDIIKSQVDGIQASSSTTMILISLVILGFAGSRLFLTMGEGLNAAYGLPVRHDRWRARRLATLFTVGVVPVMLLVMVLMVVGPMIIGLVTHYLNIPLQENLLFHLVRWTLFTLFLWLTASAIHSLVPGVRQPWYWLSPGSIFTTLGWITVSHGFRLYVENFAYYNETYGALGGVIVMMVWLYLSGAILLLGGQINSVIYNAEKERAKDEG